MKRARNIFRGLVGTIMFVWFFYGIRRFPDQPIHPCGTHEYCGKQGQPHSLADYEAYESWSTSLYVLWPSGMLCLFLSQDRSKPKPAPQQTNKTFWHLFR